ncbi:MAG: uncharacterized protein JWQ45_2682 [Blastococcus sp.]|jgi:hypothetical protein|nr:uncharacterized protein [Blastococcus sp.]
MRSLRLVALSGDGKSLILTTEGADAPDGDTFELPIDDRVRAAARGDSRRLTQIDVDLGTELPPRVIQSRIRAGETPEQVAVASGTRVERIMRFAHPVLQERARVAEQALEARVRLSEGTPGTTLQRFMADRLRLLDTDVDVVQWDAYRNDDGAWLVTGAWRAGDKSGTTRWIFDLPARLVTPDDAATTDFAEGTRLVRVVPDVPTGLPGGPPLRARPVSVLRDSPREDEVTGPAPAATDDQLEDGGTAHDGYTDDRYVADGYVTDVVNTDLLATDVPADHLTAPVRAEDDVRDVHPPTGFADRQRSVDALLDEVADHDTVVLARTEADGDTDDPRARVPAWEDIVFGVRRHR